VRFIHQVEDDMRVGLELVGKLLPEYLEPKAGSASWQVCAKW
jgi:hypothetical protein